MNVCSIFFRPTAVSVLVAVLTAMTLAGNLFGQRYKRVHQEVLDLITAGESHVALARLEALQRGDFDDVETQFMVSMASAQLGRIDEASVAMRRAIEMGLPPERFLAGPRELFRPIDNQQPMKQWVEHFANRPIHGPMLGSVTDTSARFWFRTARESRVTVSVRPVSGPVVKLTGENHTSAENDFTTVLQVNGLEPDTVYDYVVALDGRESPPDTAVQRFRTSPGRGSACRFRLVFGGGAGYVPKNERMWDTIRSFDPDLLLLLGDNVYIDHPESPAMQRYCYYRRQSRPEFRQLVARVPVYAIWDDHDFGTNDGTGGPAIDAPAWKRPVWEVFRSNWVNPYFGGGPAQPGCFFDFYYGDVHFILLDGRFYRTRRGKPDATMLGPAQKQWLLKTIKASRGTFKVLCSPVPWVFTAKGNSHDTWNGFRNERDEVFNFLAQNNIDGVVLISADRHRSDLWKIDRRDGYPLYEFNSSRLTNQGIAATVPEALFSYNEKQSFGLVSCDTEAADPVISYRIVTIDGETVHKFSLNRSQLINE